MSGYNQIINTDDFTVVSEYVSDKKNPIVIKVKQLLKKHL